MTTPTPEPGGAGPEPEPESGAQKRWGLWLLWLLLLPVLVFLYVRLRQQVCKNRTRRMLQGNGRDAVLYGYGELLRLIRHGASENDDAQALADEAAFSDHLLGEAQKRAMAGYVKAARKELEGALPRHKLWYLRYVLWLW